MIGQTPDVTIVGAGMAGMTAALRLLEAGFSVKVIEASDTVGGKFGARYAKRGRHDFAWHVFADWCLNFWDVAQTIGLSKTEDFVPHAKHTLLRPDNGAPATTQRPRAATIWYVGSPEFFRRNAQSGLADWSDLFLFAYSHYALLCDQSLETEEFLNRVPVNGYVRSLPFVSDVAALLHNELLLRIWAIPSYLISARAYQTYLQLIAPFPYPAAPVMVLKKNFEDGFWQPFLRSLKRFGGQFELITDARLTGIQLAPQGDRIDEIVIRRGAEARVEKVNRLIVAIPPEAVVRLLSDPDSRALRERLPRLLNLAKLPSQQTSALTLYLKRRMDIPGVGEEPVSLIQNFEAMYDADTLSRRSGIASEYGLSLLEVSRMWGTDHPTVYTVLASDADALGPLDDDEACRRVMAELQRYIPFKNEDVDWEYTHFQSHTDERLFVNAVGSWENRLEVRLHSSTGTPLYQQVWRRHIRNLFFAGDYCRSQIDIVSLEGAAHTGIWAARAVSQIEIEGGKPAVRTVNEPRPPREWDREGARRYLGQLGRWVSFAEKRSRKLADEMRKAVQGHGSARWTAPTTVAAGQHRVAHIHTRGEAAMSEALSTFPGLATPIPVEEDRNRWFVHKYRDYRARVTLKPGAVVPIPMFFWDARALVLHGTADPDAVDAFLPSGLHAARDKEGKAAVDIWAPDYGGTTVGPIKVMFASIQVAPRITCPKSHKSLSHAWWWWYYGNSPINQQFKREVWGIGGSQLGVVETSYAERVKTARLLEDGQTAVRLKFAARSSLKWHIVSNANFDEIGAESDIGKRLAELSEQLVKQQEADELSKERYAPDKGAGTGGATAPTGGPSKPAGPAPLCFVSVAGRSTDDSENEVELVGAKLKGSAEPFMSIKFEDGKDEFHLKEGSVVEKRLSSVGFKEMSWDFYASYNGVVQIYDEKGSGVKPKSRDETRSERIGDRLLELIPALKPEK
jgi:Flavin containing amine oxidoreductase